MVISVEILGCRGPRHKHKNENIIMKLCFKSDEIMKSPCSKGALRKWMLICALSNTSCQLVRGSAAQKLSGVFHSGNKNHRAQGHVPVRTRLKIFNDVSKKNWLNYDCVCDIDIYFSYGLKPMWTRLTCPSGLVRKDVVKEIGSFSPGYLH